MRFSRFLLIPLLLVSNAAPAQAPKEFSDSVGTVYKLVVRSLTRKKAMCWVRATLPNAPKGWNQRLEGELSWADVALPSKQPVEVAIQHQDKIDATFIFDVDLDKLPKEILTKTGTRALDLAIRGTLVGDKGERQKICAVGVLRLGTSDIDAAWGSINQFFAFGGAHLTGLSLTEATGEAKAVFFNPFGFPIAMKDLTYSLYVGERKMAEGKREPKLIQAGRETTLDLPIRASTADLLAAAGKAAFAKAGDTVEGRLVAQVTFRIGQGEIAVPINMPGKVRVK